MQNKNEIKVKVLFRRSVFDRAERTNAMEASIQSKLVAINNMRLSANVANAWNGGAARRGDAGLVREGYAAGGNVFPMNVPRSGMNPRNAAQFPNLAVRFIEKSPGVTGAEQLVTFQLVSRVMKDGSTQNYGQGDCLFTFAFNVTEDKYVTMDPFRMNTVMKRDTESFKTSLQREMNGLRSDRKRRRERMEEADDEESYTSLRPAEWETKFRFAGIAMSGMPTPSENTIRDAYTRQFTIATGGRVVGVRNMWGDVRTGDHVGFEVTKLRDSTQYAPAPSVDEFSPLVLVPAVSRVSIRPYAESCWEPIEETIRASGGIDNMMFGIGSQRMVIGYTKACFMNHIPENNTAKKHIRSVNMSYKPPRDLAYRDVFYKQVKVGETNQWRQCALYELSHYIPCGLVKRTNGSMPSHDDVVEAITSDDDCLYENLKRKGTLDILARA